MKSFLFCVLLSIVLFGCYTRRKAEKQVNFAAVTFPDILAKKARDLFPCVTKGGDTIWLSDSAAYNLVLQDLQNQYYEMYVEKDSLNKVLDDMKGDTLCVDMVDALRDIISQRDKKIEVILNKVNHLPPITKTIIIHDTTVDNAAVKACMIDNSNLAYSLKAKTDENDGWRKKAKNRFWWILGMGAVIGVGGFFTAKRMFTPKLKSV